MTEDERLLRALAAGSHDAFGQIFDAHADFVFNVALRRTGSMTDAEDIAAEVFAELWRQRSTLEPRYGSVRPWLAGTATNLTRRHWRSTERRHRALLRLRSQSERISDDLAEEAVAKIEGARRADRVRTALLDLPADQYAVLTLSVWEGLSHEETAEALGVAIGTVKSRLSRARSKLELSIGTEAAVRAFPGDRPSGAVGGQPAARAEGGCT